MTRLKKRVRSCRSILATLFSVFVLSCTNDDKGQKERALNEKQQLIYALCEGDTATQIAENFQYMFIIQEEIPLFPWSRVKDPYASGERWLFIAYMALRAERPDVAEKSIENFEKLEPPPLSNKGMRKYRRLIDNYSSADNGVCTKS